MRREIVDPARRAGGNPGDRPGHDHRCEEGIEGARSKRGGVHINASHSREYDRPAEQVHDFGRQNQRAKSRLPDERPDPATCGARLSIPPGERVETQAIGRGTTTDVRKE